MPVADFRVGDLHFCKTDSRYGPAPAAGDTLFVLVDRAFVNDSYIELVNETGYLRVLPNGRVLLPMSMSYIKRDSLTAADVERLAMVQ